MARHEIAFLRAGASAGVFVVSPLGGPERKVADSGSRVGWMPEGRSLLIRDRVAEATFGIFRST